MDKTYEITRRLDGDVVCDVQDLRTGRSYPLPHIIHHSPTGFECGYPGSGPADLALSILADLLGAGFAAMQARIHGMTDEATLYSMAGEYPLTGEYRRADEAVRHYQDFKMQFIAPLCLEPGQSHHIDEAAIKEWLLVRTQKGGNPNDARGTLATSR
jgi:hypothetical protein